MRNNNTCNSCTTVDKETKKYTTTPDSRCDCRKCCPDDASSTEKREQIITELGHIWDGGANVEGKCESF